MTKNTLYHIVENITPPLLFRLFKKSAPYQWILRLLKNFSKPSVLKEFTITDGDFAGLKLKLSGVGSWQEEMIHGTYDHELFTYIKSHSLHGKVIYDIGSHIGYHSLAFAKYAGHNGRVFAFEPNPANVDRALEIAHLNPDVESNITTLNIALSNTTGSVDFLSSTDVEGGTSTGGFIDEAKTIWPKEVFIEKTGFKVSKVPVQTIDGLLNEAVTKPPHLMKIDVEGAEQLVLEGAKNTIAKYKPEIIVEFHSTIAAYSCMQFLHNHGYVVETLKIEPDGRVMVAAT